MNMKKYLPFIAVLIVVVAVAGFLLTKDSNDEVNEDASTSQTTNKSASESSNSETQVANKDTAVSATAKAVSIENFAFSADKITVKVGTKVNWTNKDSVAHTVTSDSGTTLNSDLIATGESFSFTFNDVGTFGYHCKPHPSMTGTVVVTE